MPADWTRIKEAYLALLDLPAADRPAALDVLDDGLRDEVAALLAAEDTDAGPLALPPTVDMEAVAAVLGRGADPEGTLMGPYRIEAHIGRGGMGEVYRAVRADGLVERPVALKVVKRGADTVAVLARFDAERRILGRLRHPGIARLLDAGTADDGRPWIAMDLVEGQPLTDYADARALDVPARLRLLADIARIVHVAHQNLVVHRDLKPSNVMVADGDDGRPRPVLLDFGIAKLLDPDTATGEDTATGVRPMTRTYAAPEQVRGEPATTATDVYALGLLLYHLLAGERLFADADAPAALDHAVLHTEAPPPSARAADPRAVRGDPDTICLAALRKAPDERYASAEALAADIDRYLTGIPIAARAPTVGYRVRRFVQRHRLGVATAAAFVLLLAGASVVTTHQSIRLAETAREATLARDRAEAVSDFLTGLFEASDPSVEAGDVSVREVLDRGAERLGEDLADQPEVRSDLLRVVGKVYVSLGLYEPAEARLREAVATARAAGAEEIHADALLNLGNLLYRLDRFGEARAALEQSHRRIVDVHGPDDPTVATVLNSLALVYQSGGDTTRSLEMLEQVVAIRRENPGDEPGRTLAINLSNLADLLVETGDLARAEGLYDEALGLVRDDVGPEHPYVAFLLNSRAGLHQTRRDLAGARADQAEAVRIGLAAFGEDHPFTAVALHNLGAIERDAGRRDAARQAFARALAIRERTLPPDNPDVLESREALASLR